LIFILLFHFIVIFMVGFSFRTGACSEVFFKRVYSSHYNEHIRARSGVCLAGAGLGNARRRKNNNKKNAGHCKAFRRWMWHESLLKLTDSNFKRLVCCEAILGSISQFGLEFFAGLYRKGTLSDLIGQHRSCWNHRKNESCLADMKNIFKHSACIDCFRPIVQGHCLFELLGSHVLAVRQEHGFNWRGNKWNEMGVGTMPSVRPWFRWKRFQVAVTNTFLRANSFYGGSRTPILQIR